MNPGNKETAIIEKWQTSTVLNLKYAIESLKKISDDISRIIAPTCTFLSREVANKFLNIRSSINDSMYPFMSGHLNVNVNTGTFHTEKDVTYTILYVPRQHIGQYIFGRLSFLFRLNDNVVLQFEMCEGFSMMFSGLLLSHRQNLKTDKFNIINFSAYADRRIFSSMRKSLEFGVKAINLFVICGGIRYTYRNHFESI